MKTSTQKQDGAAQANQNGFSLISNEKLLQLYAAMVNCRGIAERAASLDAPHAAAALGWEAVLAGVALDLRPGDTIAPSLLGEIAGFIRDEPLEKTFRRLPARDASLDLAAQLHLATGAALASGTKKNGGIALAFRDSKAPPSDCWPSVCWEEALSVAGVHRLPILFVCPAALSAKPAKPKRQTGADRIAGATEFRGLPAFTVDGEDVVAVYRVATESIAHARKGNGPTLIECWMNPSEARDPILNMEAYLTRKGLFSESLKRETAAGSAKSLQAAIEAIADSRNF